MPSGEATSAFRKATEDLARVRGMWPRINSVSDQLDRELEINGFGDRFAAAWRERS